LLERLQKIIARAGVASRREAEGLITDGLVTVNGEQITELGFKADASKDHIKVNGKLVKVDEDMTYILLNKPKGVVTTVHDPEGRVTVTALLNEIKARIYPVGRLDFNTEGALLLTNDGNLTHQLLAPKSKCPKTYMVKVSGNPDKKTLARLERGITVDGNRFGRCEIESLKAGSNSWLRVVLFEGKNHQIKKMFETVGHPVSKLRRIAFAFLTTKGLKPGEWRYLNPVEIDRLQRGDYKSLTPINPFKFLREVGVSLKASDYENYRKEKGQPPLKKREGDRRRSVKGRPKDRRGKEGQEPYARDRRGRDGQEPYARDRRGRDGQEPYARDRRGRDGQEPYARDRRDRPIQGRDGEQSRERDDRREKPRGPRRAGADSQDRGKSQRFGAGSNRSQSSRGEGRRSYNPEGKLGDGERRSRTSTTRSRSGPSSGGKSRQPREMRDGESRRPAKFKAKRPQKAWSKSLDRSGKKGSQKK